MNTLGKIGVLLAALLMFAATADAGNKFTRAKQQRKATAQKNNANDKGYERGMKQLKEARKHHSKVMKEYQDRKDKKAAKKRKN